MNFQIPPTRHPPHHQVETQCQAPRRHDPVADGSLIQIQEGSDPSQDARKGKAEASLTASDPSPDSANVEARTREDNAFQQAQADLRLAVEQSEELRNFQDSLLIDNTPEGLRIQLVEQQKKSMFKPGGF